MKRILAMLLALMMMFSMVACGGEKEEEPAKDEQQNEEQNATEEKEEEPKEPQKVDGGHFTMAIEESINSLVWYNNNSTDQGEQVFQSLYDPLWNMNLDGTKDYYLAESCDLSEDGLTYTVKMRQDAYWHDGEQVTADDVIYTLTWFSNPDCGSPNAAASYKVDGEFCTFEKVDDFTFTVSIVRPSNMFASRLGYLHPFPEHIFKDVPVAEVLTCEEGNKGIGTGAFMLDSFTVGEKMVLKRNDNYYGDKANLDTVEVRCIPNTGTQEVAFRNGELSVYTISNAETLNKFETEAQYDIHSYDDTRICFMQINPNAEATSTMEARQAIIYALNLEEIVLGTYGSDKICVVANSIMSPASMFYNPDIKNYEQDIAKSKELIAQTGLADKTIKIIFNSARVGQEEMSIMIQSQLQAVGLNVEVEGMETSGYFTSYFRATDTYNIALMANGMKGDPGNYCGLFNNTRSGANMYTTEEVNNLWTEIDKEADPAKRQELVNEVLAKLQECWSCVPFAETYCVYAAQTNIRGFEDTNRMTDLTKLYFVE
ncbi:MAG: ABC transporter substrate-binding protein [Clostridia bacterium]|nr:ABC transporter substrate-binding protein [Clostridia bacterium]MBQ5812544.1 ABC transporter substrate-binding protein [Clostridia bacterium]